MKGTVVRLTLTVPNDYFAPHAGLRPYTGRRPSSGLSTTL